MSANGILHVALSEYRVAPQNVSARAGTLTIFVHNYGRLNHNLVISYNGIPEASTQPIRPGPERRADRHPDARPVRDGLHRPLRPGARGVRLADRRALTREIRLLGRKEARGLAANDTASPGVGFKTFATFKSAFVLLRRQPEVSSPGLFLSWLRPAAPARSSL